MEPIENRAAKKSKTGLWRERGRTYFSRDSERKFYFILSLILFFAGLCYKTGVL